MSKAESLVKQWLRHRTVVLDLLDKVPDDKADFRPWDSAMTLSELALHIATSADMFVSAVRTGEMARPPKVQSGSMEETRAIVREYTQKDEREMLALTDEQIEGMVSAKAVFGFDAPGKIWLHSMREHEIHHKGQLFVYARMAGVQEMPFFINRSI